MKTRIHRLTLANVRRPYACCVEFWGISFRKCEVKKLLIGLFTFYIQKHKILQMGRMDLKQQTWPIFVISSLLMLECS